MEDVDAVEESDDGVVDGAGVDGDGVEESFCITSVHEEEEDGAEPLDGEVAIGIESNLGDDAELVVHDPADLESVTGDSGLFLAVTVLAI